MKKKLFMAFSLVMMAAATHAELTNDTTIIVKNPAQIKIKQSDNSLSIEVKGNETNPNYLYSTTLSCGDDALIVTEEKSREFNFNFPFAKNNESHRRCRSEITMGGFGFGMVNAVNSPSGMKVDMGASYEFMISNLLAWQYRPWKNGTAFALGFGLNWKNYRMTGKTQFIKENNDLILGNYPDNADINFSRIKVFSLTASLTFVQQINRDIKIGVGPVVNFNTHASLKTRYKLNGDKVKIMDENIHQTPVTVDLMGSISFKSIGLYFKYSPSKVLNTDFGPKFSSMSTGLILFY